MVPKLVCGSFQGRSRERPLAPPRGSQLRCSRLPMGHPRGPATSQLHPVSLRCKLRHRRGHVGCQGHTARRRPLSLLEEPGSPGPTCLEPRATGWAAPGWLHAIPEDGARPHPAASSHPPRTHTCHTHTPSHSHTLKLTHTPHSHHPSHAHTHTHTTSPHTTPSHPPHTHATPHTHSCYTHSHPTHILTHTTPPHCTLTHSTHTHTNTHATSPPHPHTHPHTVSRIHHTCLHIQSYMILT